jgi:hypothetical protein
MNISFTLTAILIKYIFAAGVLRICYDYHLLVPLKDTFTKVVAIMTKNT